jgi:glycosyltransferase involved in cell wall biosynthesis
MSAVVSVIIAERRPGEARRAISSALGQQDVDVDVLVIGKPDGDHDGSVRFLRTGAWRGHAAAYNAGARQAAGDWIAFLGGRDRWAADHLGRMVAGCEANGSDFGCCAAWIVDDEGCIQGFRSVPAAGEMERTFLRGDDVPWPSALIVRREFWERAGGFDEWLDGFAALDLCIRWSRAGKGWSDTAPTVALRGSNVQTETRLRRRRDEFRELDRRYGEDARRLQERFGSGELSVQLAQEHIVARDYMQAARWVARSSARRSPRLYLRLLGLIVAGSRSRAASDVMRPLPARRLRWQEAERSQPSKR